MNCNAAIRCYQRLFLCCLQAFVCGVSLCFSSGAVAQSAPNEARIGVLAYRGSDQLQIRWLTLRDYLNAEISDWSFEIVPMTLSLANQQIDAGQLDFVITNPGHFVTLNKSYRLSVLASRSQSKSDGTLSGEFGSTIFTLKGSGIATLEDAAGKSIVAVDRNAFGGFQMAWYEFDRAGVDLLRSDQDLRFVGFPMDQVVLQVLAGKTDVGIVRSGLIEEMAREGRIDPEAFAYLNTNVTYSHPDRVSTGLYPEFPFVAVAGADQTLKNRVTLALLQAQGSPVAKTLGVTELWQAPVPYHGVLEVLEAFKARTAPPQIIRPWPIRLWFGGIFILVLIAAGLIWQRLRSIRTPCEEVPEAPDKAEEAGLTRRERQVLTLVAQGDSTKEIAIKLQISPKTVEFHRANLLRKFGARTSSQLVALAT
tara:strand:- start:771 stop:2036 length:1266 start_codon:yes stop_codon:yes gene_type:complete